MANTIPAVTHPVKLGFPSIPAEIRLQTHRLTWGPRTVVLPYGVGARLRQCGEEGNELPTLFLSYEAREETLSYYTQWLYYYTDADLSPSDHSMRGYINPNIDMIKMQWLVGTRYSNTDARVGSYQLHFGKDNALLSLCVYSWGALFGVCRLCHPNL